MVLVSTTPISSQSFHNPRPKANRIRPRRISPTVAALEQRIVLDDSIYKMGGWNIELRADAVSTAAAIPITLNGAPIARQGDQVVISRVAGPLNPNDLRQILVLDTNGFLRLRHRDGGTHPSSEDRFGTSLKLPPTLITSGPNFFLSPNVEQIDIQTDHLADGFLHLRMQGRPANAASGQSPTKLPIALTWDLSLFDPTNSETHARLTTTARFEQTVQLSQTHLAQGEAFRAAEFSSSNVDATNTSGLGQTHDADQLLATSKAAANLANLNLNTIPRNQLLFAGNGIAFDGGLALNQTVPAPLNIDPPNIRIHLAPDGAEYRAQGFLSLGPEIDENSDNLGVWVSRTFASPTISAGTVLTWTQKILASEAPTSYLNSAPLVANPGSTTIFAGDRVVRDVYFIDEDPADSWTATVDYGDGSGSFEIATKLDQTFLIDHVYSEPGTYQVLLTVTDDEGATGSTTFQVRVNPRPTLPTISIEDLSLDEGSSGLRQVNFQALLSAPRTTPVTVAYTTIDGTASASSDYYAARGTITFAPGETRKAIPVTVRGDTSAEIDESFSMRLENPNGAILAQAQASATILNDDTRISVGNISRAEGNAGLAAFNFNVTLSSPAPGAITVRAFTTNGTAGAGTDYNALSPMTVSFRPGQISRVITVQVRGDRVFEPDERFTLNLADATGAKIARSQGVGLIRNDDRAGKPRAASVSAAAARPSDLLLLVEPSTPRFRRIIR